MKLLVGLGNPGRKYEGTRHNIGFEIIGKLATKHLAGRPKAKFNAELVDVTIGTEKVVLACPLTFMNLSGQTVVQAANFYKIEIDDVLIICDDFSLDVGRLRLRPTGSAGGHNGLKDIIRRLGTDHFSRLRVGVGRPPERWDVSDYVLARFDEQDRTIMNESVDRAVLAAEHWVGHGIQSAMNRFNGDPNKLPNTKKLPADQTGGQATNKLNTTESPDGDSEQSINEESNRG